MRQIGKQPARPFGVFPSAIAAMNSEVPDEVQGVPHVDAEVTVEITAPKPKRIARSRELAMLLENITNLAPPSGCSSDRASSDDEYVSQRRVAKSAKVATSGKPMKKLTTKHNHDSHTARIDAVASKAPSVSRDSSDSACAVDGAGCNPPDSFDCAPRNITPAASLPSAQQPQCSDPSHNMSSYRSRVADSVTVSVTGASGLVYGDIIYADDSSLAAAAVHAGLLSLGETGSVRVYILGPYKGFVSSFRNNIKSHSYPKWPGSFSFVPDALQQAAAAAAERKRILLERRAAAKAAKCLPTRSNSNSSGSDSSRSCSSSDSEPVAAHWDTPAVPEHLQALAQIGKWAGLNWSRMTFFSMISILQATL